MADTNNEVTSPAASALVVKGIPVGVPVPVDAELDPTSDNPVSNKAVCAKFNDCLANDQTIFTKLTTWKLLGSAMTPKAANTAVEITLNEDRNNFVFLYIKYGYGWGASHLIMLPLGPDWAVPFIQEGGGPGFIRIDSVSNTKIKVTTGTHDIGVKDTDNVQIYGIMRRY